MFNKKTDAPTQISAKVTKRVQGLPRQQLVMSVDTLLYDIGSNALHGNPGDPRFDDAVLAAEALWAVMLELRRRG